MLYITQNIDPYTQHATHYTEHWYLHTTCYTLHRTLILTHNMLHITQNIVINIIRYSDTHLHRTCYTLHRTLLKALYSDTMHIVQNIDIDAHYTEHWYKLHRTLMHIVQNIFTHSTTHLYTLHNTFIVIHIAQNINTLVQNIIYWTLCRTLHFTHTQTTHTLNISWDISLTHSKVSLWCAVKYTNTYPSRELPIFRVFILTSWCITNDGRRRGADARRWLYLFPYPLWAPV